MAVKKVSTTVLADILSALSGFSTGSFKARIEATDDPQLNSIIDEINKAAQALGAQAEKTLNKTFIQSLSQLFFDGASFGLNLCRMDGTWVQSNRAFYKMIGYTREEADGRLTYWQLTPRKYDEMEKLQLQRLVTEGCYGPYEKEFIQKDGTLIPVRLNGFIVEKDGEKLIWSIIEDLSNKQSLEQDLKKNIKRLEEQTAFLNAVLETIPTAIFLKDIKDQFKVTHWNKAAEEIFELPREMILGKTAHDLWPRDQADLYLAADRKIASEGVLLDVPEEPSQSKTRGTIYLHTKKLPIRLGVDQDVRFLLCISEDITERRNSVIALANRVNETQKLINGIPGMIGYWDNDLRNQYSNLDLARFLGMSPEEIRGKHLKDLLGESVFKIVEMRLMGVMSGEYQNFESSMYLPDGTVKHFHQTYQPDFLNEKVIGFFGVAFDITELRESERLLGEAQRVAKMGSWILTLGTQELRWSKEMFSLFGMEDSHVDPKMKHRNEMIRPEDRVFWKETVGQCIKDGQPYKIRVRSPFPELHLWLEIRGEVQRNSEGRIVALRGTCQDITDLVTAEEVAKLERSKSIQNGRLASLGEMSAGIAHEINNPLAIISGSVGLLGRFVNNPEKFARNIEAMERACARIAKIVGGLKKFSRSSERSNYSSCLLSEIVKETLVLVETKSKRHNTAVSFSLKSETPINCDEVEIEQVVINLLNNSIDAVSELDEKWVKVEILDDALSVVLRVTDSGTGIPEEIQQKLFDPFFTTKAVGEGTGLGLSITKGILDEHKATIAVVSDGPNTCFEVRFMKSAVGCKA
jgi:PAS domain S-box-containing protein